MEKVERPWGNYTVIYKGKRFKVKIVEVYPKQRLSLQKHRYRTEHWVIVEGKAKITIGDKVIVREHNESAYIHMQEPHRLENPTDNLLKIIEVQCGDYLEEDDIERIDDDYKR